MKSHARVVVIGGGVVGCSVLYHLAKMGWKKSEEQKRAEEAQAIPAAKVGDGTADDRW